MPRSITAADLRLVAWLAVEAIHHQLNRIERKVDIVMALVSVDDQALQGIVTTLATIDDSVQALVAEHNIPDGSPQVAAISDAIAKIQTDLEGTGTVSTGGAPTPVGDGSGSDSPTTPGDTSTPPPADGGTPVDTGDATAS